MFSIVTQPAQDGQVLSGNPVIITVQAQDKDGNPFMWLGLRSELRIVSGTYLQQDESFVLNFMTEDGYSTGIGFLARDFPIQDFHIPSQNTSGYPTNVAYWQAVAAIIEAHPRIGPFVKVYTVNNGASISLWAVKRDISSAGFVKWNKGDLTTPPFEVFDYDSVQITLAEQYQVRAKVLLEQSFGSNDFLPVASLKNVPGIDSLVNWDIQHILNKEIERLLPDPPIPNWGTVLPQIADVQRRARLVLWETAEGLDAADYEDVKESNEFIAWYGGIAQNLFAVYDFFAGLDADNAFLTWKPDWATLDPHQPEWLAWYNHIDAPQDPLLSLEVKQWSAEEQLPTRYYFHMHPSTPMGRISLLPVGPRQLGLADDVVRYSVRVVQASDGSSPLDPLTEDPTEAPTWDTSNPFYHSQERHYYIDRSYREEVHYLAYLNSFGLPEILRCTGDLEINLNVKRQESERVLAPGFTGTVAQRFQYQEEWEDRFSYRSGYLRREDIEALRELLIYGKVWEISERGYIPLLLKSTSFPITATRRNLHSVSIEARPAIDAVNYSNLITEMIASQADYWEEPNGDFWLDVFGQPWQTS